MSLLLVLCGFSCPHLLGRQSRVRFASLQRLCWRPLHGESFRFLYNFYFTTSIQMDGVSMLPTFDAAGELIIENILSYRLSPHTLARGQLITLESPLTPNRIICKRVIGLPGDVICVDPTGLMAPSTDHVVVPKGHVWIAGDNASCSRDSRVYGPVSMALIRGKVVARVCSVRSFGAHITIITGISFQSIQNLLARSKVY